MLRILSAAALVALVAAPAVAQTAKVEAAKVEAGTYALDPSHAEIEFDLLHFGFTPYRGLFSNVTGTLKLDPAKPAASALEVSIPTDSIYTPVEKLTTDLKGDQWFDSAKYPTATFKSTKVTRTGANTAKVEGDLTLHGVTKPVTLSVKYINAGTNPLNKKYTVGFEATTRIKRSDFGVKTYVPLIGDEVDLTIAAPFERQG